MSVDLFLCPEPEIATGACHIVFGVFMILQGSVSAELILTIIALPCFGMSCDSEVVKETLLRVDTVVAVVAPSIGRTHPVD